MRQVNASSHFLSHVYLLPSTLFGLRTVRSLSVPFVPFPSGGGDVSERSERGTERK